MDNTIAILVDLLNSKLQYIEFGVVVAILGLGYKLLRDQRKGKLRLQVGALWVRDESKSEHEHFIKLDITNLSEFPVTITRIALDRGRIGMVRYRSDLENDGSLPKKLDYRHGHTWHLPISAELFSDHIVRTHYRGLTIETSGKETFRPRLTTEAGFIAGEDGYGRFLLDHAKKIDVRSA